ncbi:MAG TPA: phosphodiester glycosidase family protein [Anaerolineales bacterium]|nr:phosphodiester glycosidase family protein [Anaerolineales bacterium]
MQKRNAVRIVLGFLALLVFCVASYLIYDRGRPAPIPMKMTLYEGITYQRIVRVVPHPMIAHVIVIDRRSSNVEFLVTPPDADGDMPLKARTTSQFLEEFGVQIAINGDGFTPWWSRSPADYYPHAGDPVAPLGFAASNGKVYAKGVETSAGARPTLYISRRNFPSFNNRPGNIYQAISGDRMLIQGGKIVEGLDHSTREPRTAIGINRNGRYVYLVVVDGRQPYYSDGATFLELAELLLEQGAYFAMSLDGGGSSTMVIEGEDGKPVVLNSPIDNYIPGRERPVANHFGVYINPKTSPNE